MRGGTLASTFLVGGPRTLKDPVLGVSRHSGSARAVGLAPKRLRHAELENPTRQVLGLENPL